MRSLSPGRFLLPDVPFKLPARSPGPLLGPQSTAGITVGLVILPVFPGRGCGDLELFLMLVIPGKPDPPVLVTSNLSAGSLCVLCSS